MVDVFKKLYGEDAYDGIYQGRKSLANVINDPSMLATVEADDNVYKWPEIDFFQISIFQ